MKHLKQAMGYMATLQDRSHLSLSMNKWRTEIGALEVLSNLFRYIDVGAKKNIFSQSQPGLVLWQLYFRNSFLSKLKVKFLSKLRSTKAYYLWQLSIIFHFHVRT